MSSARALAATTACLGWLVAATSYGAGAHATAASAEPAGPVDLGGHPLPGGAPSTDRADPVVLPAGLWADTLGAPDSATSTHYFRYDRAMADSTVHLGVIAASEETEASEGLGIEVTAGGEDCGTDDGGPGYPVLAGTIGAGVAVGPDEAGDRDAPCLTATSLDIAVTRGTSATGERELPVAIKIVEEAPVGAATELPPVEEVSAGPVTVDAEPTRVEGATGFDDAPLLDGGSGVVDTAVTEGEERLFRVPLTWGERLAVTARLPAREPQGDEVFVPSSAVELHFVSPERDAFAGLAGEAEPSGQYGDEPAELYDSTPRVNYLNRYDDDDEALLPGDYWVSVAAPLLDDIEPVEVPVELTFEVDGERDGVPSYPQTVTAPGGAEGPAGYAPETPFLVGADDFAAVASGSPAPPDDADPGGWGTRQWAGVGLGLASAACLAAGLVLWRRPLR